MYNMHMPVLLRILQFSFYFYSKEGPKPHIHVRHSSGVEVIIWLDKDLGIKKSSGKESLDIAAKKLVKKHYSTLLGGWNKHFEVIDEK